VASRHPRARLGRARHLAAWAVQATRHQPARAPGRAVRVLLAVHRGGQRGPLAPGHLLPAGGGAREGASTGHRPGGRGQLPGLAGHVARARSARAVLRAHLRAASTAPHAPAIGSGARQGAAGASPSRRTARRGRPARVLERRHRAHRPDLPEGERRLPEDEPRGGRCRGLRTERGAADPLRGRAGRLAGPGAGRNRTRPGSGTKRPALSRFARRPRAEASPGARAPSGSALRS
jgi:hypothetical protein